MTEGEKDQRIREADGYRENDNCYCRGSGHRAVRRVEFSLYGERSRAGD